jgi:hypothetical protein
LHGFIQQPVPLGTFLCPRNASLESLLRGIGMRASLYERRTRNNRLIGS